MKHESIFIHKCTQELIDRLSFMGYKVFPNIFNALSLSCRNDICIPADGLNRNGGFDCGEDEELFIEEAREYLRQFRAETEFERRRIIDAKVRTFDYEHKEKTLCPKCGLYILINGRVCYGCGYAKQDDK